jgi:hypothetical protein
MDEVSKWIAVAFAIAYVAKTIWVILTIIQNPEVLADPHGLVSGWGTPGDDPRGIEITDVAGA